MKKKFWIASFSIAAISVLAGASAVFAANELPSVELETNQLQKVIRVSTNQEGADLLKGLQMEGMELDDAVDLILYRSRESQTEITVKDKNADKEKVAQMNLLIDRLQEAEYLERQIDLQKVDFTDPYWQDMKETTLSKEKEKQITSMLQEKKKVSATELVSFTVDDLYRYAEEQKLSFSRLLDQYADAIDDILDWDGFAKEEQKKAQDQKPQSLNGIGWEKAVALAQAKAPQAKVTDWDLDREHGKLVYEIELRDGKKEIEITIDALTGDILDTKQDWDDDLSDNNDRYDDDDDDRYDDDDDDDDDR